MLISINKIFSSRTLSKIILLVFFSLYLIFPSGVSTTDGWNYAAEIKYAGEIFHPHHLLYNALGFVVCYLPAKAGIGVLECMKAMNAFFALLTLLVIQMILRRAGKNEFTVFIVSCLTGFSFSIMRFATENETYIIPLFFALSASYNYLQFTFSSIQKYAIYSAIWATLSILFHQIFIFWWMGILIGIILSKKPKPVIWYILISLTAPFVYLIVILNTSGNLRLETIIGFVSGDFPDNAQLGITAKGMLFSGISLIRSFIQVHGYIFNMIRSYHWLFIPGIISIVLFLYAIVNLPAKNYPTRASSFIVIHIIIMMFQFLFAVFAAGNAEFMIMIPVLVFILVPFLFNKFERFLSGIMAGMAIWNLAYGIVPLHFNTSPAEEFLCNVAVESRQTLIIASDDQLFKCMIFYRSGKNDINNILKSPGVMKLKKYDTRLLENAIDSALSKGSVIYTDCIGHIIISRASISEGSTNKDFFSKYKTAEIKSWGSMMGKKSVSRIEEKL